MFIAIERAQCTTQARVLAWRMFVSEDRSRDLMLVHDPMPDVVIASNGMFADLGVPTFSFFVRFEHREHFPLHRS
jgi:hypothetical protein